MSIKSSSRGASGEVSCKKPSGHGGASAFVVLQYLHKHHIRSRRRASGRSPPRVPGAPRELPDAAKPWVGRALQGVGRPQVVAARLDARRMRRGALDLELRSTAASCGYRWQLRHPMWGCCKCLGLNMANGSCHMGPMGAGRGAFGGAWRGQTMAFVWGKSVGDGGQNWLIPPSAHHIKNNLIPLPLDIPPPQLANCEGSHAGGCGARPA